MNVGIIDKGQLISWGLLKYGEGGHGDRQPVRKPKVIKMDDPSIRFIDVSCGDKHTIALTCTCRTHITSYYSCSNICV
jgi:alpha-tubulin suppressor-like RCC1 family protein